MTRNIILEKIEKKVYELNTEHFLSLWNKIFEEETLDKIDKKEEEHLKEVFLEEVYLFEESRLLKIRKFLKKTS